MKTLAIHHSGCRDGLLLWSVVMWLYYVLVAFI